jgi:hypothetical protein
MTAGTEAHVLREVAHVGLSGVVLALELLDVYEELTRRGLAGEGGERGSFGSRHSVVASGGAGPALDASLGALRRRTGRLLAGRTEWKSQQALERLS